MCLAQMPLAGQGANVVHELDEFFPSAGLTTAFGWTLLVEGSRVFVGIPGSDQHGSNAGDVYIFRRENGAVVEENHVAHGSLQAGDAFGTALALADSELFVGAWGDSDAAPGAGTVYVFSGQGSTWSLQSKLFASDAQNGDCFGCSVAVSGTWAVVGAAFEDGSGPPTTESGAVYVFSRVAQNLWIEQQKLVASDSAPGAAFGVSVALSDGNLFVGAPFDAEQDPNAGAVYRFGLQAGVWVEQDKMRPSEVSPGHQFGRSMSLHGARIAIGAPRDVPGSVYLFEGDGGGWHQTARIVGPDLNNGLSALFGQAVALEGNNLAVGEPWAGFGAFTGAAFVYSRAANDTWVTQAALVPTDATTGDAFGWAVAMGDGAVIVNSGSDDAGGVEGGSAYLFKPGPPTPYCSGKVSSLGCAPFVTAEGVRVFANDVILGEAGILLYGFAKSSLPFHGGTLCIKAPISRILPPKFATAGGVQPCIGVLSRNFNAQIQSGADPLLTAGQVVRAQWRQRDPADPAGFGDSLTDALQFTVAP